MGFADLFETWTHRISQHDPIIEYEDEFGRVRTARRSEVPRNLVPALEEVDEDEYVFIMFS